MRLFAIGGEQNLGSDLMIFFANAAFTFEKAVSTFDFESLSFAYGREPLPGLATTG